MEATLLSSLHTKLDDLEAKIQAYRCDLLSDFQRYSHDLLAGVSPPVASSVHRAIVQSFANYPTLRPELETAVSDSQQPDPAAFQQPAAPVEPPGTPIASSRDREAELQGLFTPSYLPLLDSSPPIKYDPRPAAPSPGASTAAATASTTAAQTTATVPLLPVMAPPAAVSGSRTAPKHGITEGGSATAGSDTPPADPQALTEAHHLVRTATEESTSSVNSDRSDTKSRRSALRRSSSTSRPPQSPRRVRFEVMGAEVLPTSSPQQVEFLTPVVASPALEDDSIASGLILGGPMDDWEPPVRKSSSTEALRALSRAPAEEGTVWTVVNPDTDEATSHSNNATTKPATERPASAEPSTSTANHHTSTIPPRAAQASNATSSYPDDVNNHGAENDDEDANSSDDEDDYLAMPKRNSVADRKPASASLTPLPPKRAVNGHSAATSLPDRSSIGSNNSSNHREGRNPAPPVDGPQADDGDDEDDLFEFEPGGLSAPPKPRERAPPPPDDDDDDEDDNEDSDGSQDDVLNTDRNNQQSLYSTSPAVPIMRPARLENSGVSRFQPGSLGSYKGRPVIMPVVRNPEVHARAASLGNFNTFVGGLDGRSGMDEADLSSFRASFVRSGFTGTPRSFTERFMLEEAQERAETLAQGQAELERKGFAQ